MDEAHCSSPLTTGAALSDLTRTVPFSASSGDVGIIAEERSKQELPQSPPCLSDTGASGGNGSWDKELCVLHILSPIPPSHPHHLPEACTSLPKVQEPSSCESFLCAKGSHVWGLS